MPVATFFKRGIMMARAPRATLCCPVAGREALGSSAIQRPNRGRMLCSRDDLRMQRAGRIIGSFGRVGIPGHQDADLLPAKSLRIIDSGDFTLASSEREHPSIGMFENSGDCMRRFMGVARRRLGSGGRARDKRMPAEAENRQLLIARHIDLSIRHDRHDIGVAGHVGP